MRIVSVVFLPTVIVALGFQAKGSNGDYSLVLQAPSAAPKTTSEIRLKVTITNNDNHAITFVRSPGPVPEEETTYRIDILDANDREPPLTDFYRELKEKNTYGGSYIGYVLGPGKSMEDEIVISRLYHLKAGEYKITVARGIRPSWQDFKQEVVRSNRITLQIKE